MTKPTITTRAGKGAALTYTELDANFTNIKDATLTLTAGSGGTAVTSDLNGTITLVAGTGVTLTGDDTAKTITIASGSATNTFSTIAVSGQSNVVADSSTDTLTLAADGAITLTTNATTDTITISSPHCFTAVAVPGQSDVTADSSSDTLTIASANSRLTITTDTSLDKVTLNVTDIGIRKDTSFPYGALMETLLDMRGNVITDNTGPVTFEVSQKFRNTGSYITGTDTLHLLNQGTYSSSSYNSGFTLDTNGVTLLSKMTTTVSTGHSFVYKKSSTSRNTAFDTGISMDNLNVRVHGTSGSAGQLQLSAVSGTMSTYVTTLGNVAGQSVVGDTSSSGITLTAGTWTSSGFRYDISAGGDLIEAHVQDQTNDRIYRVTAMHGSSTTGAFICIERLL